jgi:glutathione S-transferase
MLTLYHAPQSRSSGFLWLLEETGAPYDVKLVSIKRGDGTGAGDPANPHPHGKVPAIVHDGALVFEQTAIALYLSDAFPDAKLGPRIGEKLRGEFVTMLAYYSGVIEPSFVSKFLNWQVPAGSAGWVDADASLKYVVSRLEKGPYILGNDFCAADALYAGSFNLFMGSPLLPETPLLRGYVDRCLARPAYKRSQARDNG